MRPPGDRSHLERLLTTWSESTGVTAGRLRRIVGIAVISKMLDGLPTEEWPQRIVFKGGAALEMRFGLRARSTKDLDAAYQGDLDEAVTLIDKAITAGWSGFTGRATEVELIERAKVRPTPVRFNIKLVYHGKDFVKIPIEISSAEATSLQEPEVFFVAISLEPVHLMGPGTVLLLPLRYQIAQKLHACTEQPSNDHANDRPRDLADLMLIEELGVEQDDLVGIRAACVEIFNARGSHQWPPLIQVFPGWDALWNNLVESEGLSMSMDNAVIAVNEFVKRINAAT